MFNWDWPLIGLAGVLSGDKVRPGKPILNRLGLRAVLTYERKEPQP